MNYKKVINGIISLLFFCFILSTPLNAEEKLDKIKTVKTMSFETGQVVSDYATLKLIILDLSVNILGIGWDDRENNGIGRDRLLHVAKKIAKKYAIDLDKNTFSRDMQETKSSIDKNGPLIYGVFPSEWSEIIRIEKSGKLPMVKFRNGEIILNLRTMSIKFKGDIECIIDGQEYRYRENNWFIKSLMSPDNNAPQIDAQFTWVDMTCNIWNSYCELQPELSKQGEKWDIRCKSFGTVDLIREIRFFDWTCNKNSNYIDCKRFPNTSQGKNQVSFLYSDFMNNILRCDSLCGFCSNGWQPKKE